ncbi:hypothetical protein H2C43_14390 [Corynebacterium glutamicum]|uniref:hypothetical protein n=1 Tax=Corynebacterium glutamicum TaxID=1718 RepID=UPI0003FB1823|nr:hypothetical protein [Corynebacterium glutamicum]MBA4569826.1 hypothetical protein [Corynebacterium glutamicum]MBA4574645.1 hypothetical protein [Corynebacterium glutamicum]MBA4577501.1 hypothetical protein [Corynebacterium glutamicum]MBA4580514.1 hypothetical protein [Corynebacterium glutamicum]MBA4583370.1 hypothetical protein [Corynebacterium glutamicum]
MRPTVTEFAKEILLVDAPLHHSHPAAGGRRKAATCGSVTRAINGYDGGWKIP